MLKDSPVSIEVDIIKSICIIKGSGYTYQFPFTFRFTGVYRQKFKFQNFRDINHVPLVTYEKHHRGRTYRAFNWLYLKQPYDFFKLPADMKIEAARSLANYENKQQRAPYRIGVKNHPTYGPILYRTP